MATKRLSERDIAEMKSMRSYSVSTRRIASTFGVSKTTVNNYTKGEFEKIKNADYVEKKRPLIFRWESTEQKIFDLLRELHQRQVIVGSAHLIIKSFSLCKRYHKVLIDLGIIGKRRNGREMSTVWLRGEPDKAMVNEIWSRYFHKRRAENFIGIHQYFVGHNRLNDHLTMVELRQVWEMYQADCNIQTIALYLRINRAYALECIEAAKHLYAGGLERLKQRKIREYYLKPKGAPKTPIIHFDQPKKPQERPAAIYTNQSEWQRFVNTGS